MTAEGRGGWRVLGFVLILAVVVGLAVLLVSRMSAPSDEPYSVDSPGSSGLLALRLWLEDMGYEVRIGDSVDPDTPSRIAILFPGAELDAVDRTNLRRWIEQGNTLVVANASGLGLLSTLGVTIQTQESYSDVKLWASQPVFPSSGRDHPRVSGRALTTMTPDSDAVPAVKTEHGDPAVMVQRIGEGTVWHTGVSSALTNADLRDGWGRDLVVAALRGAPAGSVVDIVNGEERASLEPVAESRVSGPDGLWESMLTHPVGRGVLTLAGLLLLYLFTQGRRLGPPLPVGLPQSRRPSVEHILAFAGLSQRAGNREAVAAYQKARLKRRLGQPARTSAELDDEAFVAALADHGGVAADRLGALATLLTRLSHVDDEATLVRTVDEANRFSLE